ncbi:MAG: sulfatase [Spirosomataceae bacterium]
MMKNLSLLLFLAILTVAFGFVALIKVQKQAQPNILWITVEDMSPQHLGCYGGKTAKTPNIDRLASEGVLYTNAFSTAGVCAPSRNALITGMYQTSIGGHNMRNYLPGTFNTPNFRSGAPFPSYSILPPAEVKCFPEYLRKAGYYCTNNAKQDYQFEAPETVWDENSNTADWRGRTDKNQPFFSIINLEDTHESQLFSRDNMPLTVKPEEVTLLPFYQDTPTMRKDVARHLSNIEDMDRKVGDILAKLKEDGLYDNTIIFFYSDHGDCLPFVKRELFDRGLRVPLVIRYPQAQQGGTKNNELVSFVDFAPSILSLAAIPIPKIIQGQAFLGAQKAKTPRKYIFAARDRQDSEVDRVRAVSDGRFKYFKNYYPEKPYYQDLRYRKQIRGMAELLKLRDEGKLSGLQLYWFRPNKPEEELFDVQNDPYEVKNIADDPQYAAKLKELRTQHEAWVKNYGDLGALSEKEIRAKWWNGGEQAPKTELPNVVIKGNNAVIACATEGASIGYKKHASDKSWSVYTAPIRLAAGDSLLVIAQRIGYSKSDMVKLKK